MYENIGQGNALGLGNVGGFAGFNSWSSTEHGFSNAWIQNFNNGNQNFNFKIFNNYVRSVRGFKQNNKRLKFTSGAFI